MSFNDLQDLLPEITDLNAPFWDGLAAGELRLQHCRACNSVQHPPESFCYACGSQDVVWQAVEGEGEVYSFIVVHQLYHAAFKDLLPYVVAIVQLDAGPRMLGLMPGEGRPAIGARVRPRFQPIGEGRSVLTFEPAA